MQSPPFPRYLVPPRSKYSPQHHVLKHPQLPLLLQCQRPSFTPIRVCHIINLLQHSDFPVISLSGLGKWSVNFMKKWSWVNVKLVKIWHWSYVHLAATLQKCTKIAGDAKCRNVKYTLHRAIVLCFQGNTFVPATSSGCGGPTPVICWVTWHLLWWTVHCFLFTWPEN